MCETNPLCSRQAGRRAGQPPGARKNARTVPLDARRQTGPGCTENTVRRPMLQGLKEGVKRREQAKGLGSFFRYAIMTGQKKGLSVSEVAVPSWQANDRPR